MAPVPEYVRDDIAVGRRSDDAAPFSPEDPPGRSRLELGDVPPEDLGQAAGSGPYEARPANGT